MEIDTAVGGAADLALAIAPEEIAMGEIETALSINAVKRGMYAGDPYFRDAWDDILARWPDRDMRRSQLAALSLVIFRPDAIVGRRIEVALRAFEAIGALPVATFPLTYTRNTVREGWRYQLNIATRDRIDVMDLILTASPSILVLLKEMAPKEIPLTVRMSKMKGPSDPTRRAAGDLRAVLGTAQASVLTFVHISDEPADVVRELGVFLGQDDRKKAFSRADASYDGRTECLNEIDRQYALQPSNDISLRGSLDAIRDRRRVLLPEDTRIGSLLDSMETPSSVGWRAFLETCREEGLPLTRWEKIAIAAHHGCGHMVDLTPVLPDIGVDAWDPGLQFSTTS